ncbi:MAG: hypothetical protein ACOC1F_10300, partial [Myxococcota bacterium]
ELQPLTPLSQYHHCPILSHRGFEIRMWSEKVGAVWDSSRHKTLVDKILDKQCVPVDYVDVTDDLVIVRPKGTGPANIYEV